MAQILVVDDSPTVSSTLEWMLRNFGHKVCVAGDGLGALNLLRKNTPDIILLDIRLPHVDGIQLCSMIRADARCGHIPIIMLSGLSNEKDMQRAADAGANDYLTKPVDDATLLSVIDYYLHADISAAATQGR